jgi:hypothetical protein
MNGAVANSKAQALHEKFRSRTLLARGWTRCIKRVPRHSHGVLARLDRNTHGIRPRPSQWVGGVGHSCGPGSNMRSRWPGGPGGMAPHRNGSRTHVRVKYRRRCQAHRTVLPAAEYSGRKSFRHRRQPTFFLPIMPGDWQEQGRSACWHPVIAGAQPPLTGFSQLTEARAASRLLASTHLLPREARYVWQASWLPPPRCRLRQPTDGPKRRS